MKTKNLVGLFFALLFVGLFFSLPTSLAVSQVFLTRGQMPAASSTFSTSSTSPSQNSLVLLSISNTAATLDVNPSVSGTAMSWVRVFGKEDVDNNGGIIVFRAMNTTSTPSAGPIIVTFSGSQSRVAWTLSEFTSVDTSGTNGSGAIVQSSTATSSCPICVSFVASTTLNAFGSSNNAAYGTFYLENQGIGDGAIAPGDGFTEITDQDLASPASGIRMQDEWRSTATTTVDATFTDIVGVQATIGAIEIKDATVAVAAVTRKRVMAIFND